MSRPPLGPEEAALWARVVASVRPLHPGGRPAAAGPQEGTQAPVAVAKDPPAAPPTPHRRKPPAASGETLDGGWDRRLARGLVAPDFAVDLHGHTLDSAYRALDDGLARAIANGARLLLLVTGKPPAGHGEGPPRRGAIRAAVGDWLAASRHAAHIAAVRNAHPRHGGAGALYIVLRRKR